MWERRVAEFHGLAVVTASVHGGPGASDVAAEVVLDPLRLGHDVREFLVPRLVGLHRRPGPPPLAPGVQRLWDRRRRYAIIAASATALTALLPLGSTVLLARWALRQIRS